MTDHQQHQAGRQRAPAVPTAYKSPLTIKDEQLFNQKFKNLIKQIDDKIEQLSKQGDEQRYDRLSNIKQQLELIYNHYSHHQNKYTLKDKLHQLLASTDDDPEAQKAVYEHRHPAEWLIQQGLALFSLTSYRYCWYRPTKTASLLNELTRTIDDRCQKDHDAAFELN